jgi:hypothetical protein
MIRVTGYFKDHKVVQSFSDLYDAIDFKDIMDANYPLKVTFERGVYPVRSFLLDSWNTIMDDRRNPLSHIQDMQTRHVVMQLLAWMWCIIFSISVGSVTVFGVSAIAHSLFIGGIIFTIATFETAKRKPETFNLRLEHGTVGYHSPGRSRQYMWVNGQRVELDENDPGGEHE